MERKDVGGGESWVEKTEHFLCLCINAENVTFFLLNINQNIFFYLHMQDVYLHLGGFLLPPAVWVYLSSCSLLWYLGICFRRHFLFVQANVVDSYMRKSILIILISAVLNTNGVSGKRFGLPDWLETGRTADVAMSTGRKQKPVWFKHQKPSLSILACRVSQNSLESEREGPKQVCCFLMSSALTVNGNLQMATFILQLS